MWNSIQQLDSDKSSFDSNKIWNVDFSNVSKILDNPPSYWDDIRVNQYEKSEEPQKLDLGNIMITKYWAFYTNCDLDLDASDEEKEQYLNSSYYKEYIEKGYKFKFWPSFEYPNKLALYVENWEDTSIQKYGTVPGVLHTHTSSNCGVFKCKSDYTNLH
jgi:hypothetical protein